MKTTNKLLGAAAAAAIAATGLASPAIAADHRDRGGIDTEDVLTGAAILGGIAVIAAIADGDNDRRRYDNRYDSRYGGYGYGYGNYQRGHQGYGSNYGYNDRYGYGSERAALQACARQAQRIGHNVRITDVDRDDGYYRIRGQVQVLDRSDSRWNRPDYDRERFTCYARGGRIHQFRV